MSAEPSAPGVQLHQEDVASVLLGTLPQVSVWVSIFIENIIFLA